MNKKDIILTTSAAIIILLIYAIDLFKLDYSMTDWEEFGDPPVVVSHVQYLVADTPNIISYHDRNIGEKVTCYEAIAYVETQEQKTYRCCDAVETISCLEGDFSVEIPPADEQCIAELRTIFGVPDTLEGSREYQFFGECLGGRFAELTVVQIDNNGMIRWKHAKVDAIQVATSVLRCVLGPVLLFFILYTLYKFYQEKTAAPVRRI